MRNEKWFLVVMCLLPCATILFQSFSHQVITIPVENLKRRNNKGICKWSIVDVDEEEEETRGIAEVSTQKPPPHICWAACLTLSHTSS